MPRGHLDSLAPCLVWEVRPCLETLPLSSIPAHLCEGDQNSPPCHPSAREISRADHSSSLILALIFVGGKNNA